MKNVIQFSEKIKVFLRKNILLIALGVLGIFFIIMASGNADDTVNTQTTQDFCQEYVENLELKLIHVVCDVSGAKECNVMITLKSGIEYVYATDESANSDVNTQGGDKKEQSEEKITIVTDKQIGEKAVVITERYPQINGVAIICDAPDSPSLTLAIKNAAATALGIDSGKICVILKG